ncbi:MAG TPA: hypothetical protein ENK28_04870 [Aliiroseovarius sp.]|nr:hypothetical protein [Aliiroseovarius sp.]
MTRPRPTPTIPEMMAANNRAVRRARRLHQLRRLWLFLVAAIIALSTAAILTRAATGAIALTVQPHVIGT